MPRGREIALKVLPAVFAGDPARRRRFEDEARTVAALDHPNIATVAYMAPGRLAGRPSGPEADVFSLGVLFHELLTGRRPFGGASPAEVASSILRDPPLRLAVPAALARIVERCLEKDPRARYGSAELLAQELAQVELGAAAATARPIPRSIVVASFEGMRALEGFEVLCRALSG